MKRLIISSLLILNFSYGQTNNVKITILSTMVADYDYLGEWGFAALVESGGNKILFYTGFRENTFLEKNMFLNFFCLQKVTDPAVKALALASRPLGEGHRWKNICLKTLAHVVKTHVRRMSFGRGL